jgi:hypothetical protein
MYCTFFKFIFFTWLNFRVRSGAGFESKIIGKAGPRINHFRSSILHIAKDYVEKQVEKYDKLGPSN